MAKKSAKQVGREIGEAIGTEIDKERELDKECGDRNRNRWRGNPSGGGAVYGMGFIGALIYFIMHATGFWMGAFGLIKALVWPAIVVYKALEMMGM